MGNLVKAKIGIIIFSVLTILLIALLENSYYRPARIKKWSATSPLRWKDFKGIPAVFSTYDAAIHSLLYLGYDSSMQKYQVYAGQNDRHSWVKSPEGEGSDWLLAHEQYHFNITEYKARLLNEEFARMEELDEQTARQKVDQATIELAYLQNRYDTETAHSVNTDQQMLWQFRIDSMLWTHSPRPDSVFDQMTGISARFYQPSVFEQNALQANTYRGYSLYAYNMYLSVWAYQYPNEGFPDMEMILDEKYQEDSVQIVSKKTGAIHGWEQITYTFQDTVIDEETTASWINGPDYLYKIYLSYPLEEELEGYRQIGRSFISSVDFIETDSMYINAQQLESEAADSAIKDSWKNNPDDKLTYCYRYGDSVQYTFFKKPFFDSKGNLHLVYYPLLHPIPEIERGLVVIDDQDMYSFVVDSADQHIVIPAEDLKAQDFMVQFGYLIKNDTAQDCDFYYDQEYWVEREAQLSVRN